MHMPSYPTAIKSAKPAGYLSLTTSTASYRCHHSEVVGRRLFKVQLPGAAVSHDRLSRVTLVYHERPELVGLLLGPVYQLIVDPRAVRQV